MAIRLFYCTRSFSPCQSRIFALPRLLASQYYKNLLARSYMSNQQREELLAQRRRLIEEVEQARAALPAHSVRPWQWQRVEAAEEALAELDRKLEALEPA